MAVLPTALPKQIYEPVPLPWQAEPSGTHTPASAKRVLLVSPAYRAHIVAPHLGLGYLATALRRAGHEVHVVDGLREPVVIRPEWDLVGVTAMTTYFPEAVALVQQAKSLGLPVILGGPHAIADPQGSLRQSGADYVCAGEGELVITALAGGVPAAQIPGLLWWDQGQVRQNGQANFLPTVDDFGEPAWDLIDPRSYPPAPHGMIARAFPLAPVITTRGCPYTCSYCSAPITAGRRMRYRDPVRVVDEFERLVRDYGVREIQVEDDNFTIKREHVLAICEELVRRNVRVHWSLPNGVRIDRLDPELLRLMKRSGCYLMALGIESANQRILDMVHKKLDVGLVRRVVQDVVDAGIEAWGFFMIGFPTETRAEIQNTIEFALSLPLTRLQFTRTTPLPGTPIYEWWKAEWGRGQDIDWSKFNYYEFKCDWSEVPADELGRMQRRAHWRFYRRPRNFLKIVGSLRPAQYRYALRRLTNLGAFRSHDMHRPLDASAAHGVVSSDNSPPS
ncbi:MAG: B12-binding domain-containing radical SAM protein [Pirellulales bacterium]|nr:B12-binding domain-containing radical SAM protein [Pirellulales bacterium]